jgi:arginyl-tRNA synthetase
MAYTTTSMEGLSSLLQGLSVDPISPIDSDEILVKPVEIWRAHLAGLFSRSGLLECEAEVIQDAITSTADASFGDLTLVLPRLKLKGVNKDGLKKLGFDLGSSVRSSAILRSWLTFI